MGYIEIGLVVLSIGVLLVGGSMLFFAQKVYREALKLAEAAHDPGPRKKQVLVPGKGIFQVQKPKIKPIYKSDEEVWRDIEDSKKKS